MKVPNSDEAVIDIRKITEYCLNPEHPRGKHKAQVFQSALGLRCGDAEELRKTLIKAVRTSDCVVGETDKFGVRYIVDFDYIKEKKRARVRSTWIIKTGETLPRLTSCFVL